MKDNMEKERQAMSRGYSQLLLFPYGLWDFWSWLPFRITWDPWKKQDSATPRPGTTPRDSESLRLGRISPPGRMGRREGKRQKEKNSISARSSRFDKMV